MRDIGKNIKDLRQQKGMTQEELAEKLFVTRQTISNYEQGKTRPDVDMLILISEALQTDINDILYGAKCKTGKRNALLKILFQIIFLFILSLIYKSVWDWEQEFKIRTFNAGPVYWLIILLRPFLYALYGCTASHILTLSVTVRPLKHTIWKALKWTGCAAILLYLIIMFPYLFSSVQHVPVYSFPRGIVLYLLDLVPNKTSIFHNGIIAFVLAFVLCTFSKANKSSAV